jgi:hypothetical protein
MTRRVAIILVTASALVTLAITGLVPWAHAEDDAPARALVPNSGYSVLGDGQFPTVTAEGLASSEYANREWSMGVQDNEVAVVPDNATAFGRVTLITEQTASQPAQPVRWLVLNMPGTGIANFRCDYGPEDPTHASNKKYARLGAQISVFGGKAQLLCFQRNSSSGAYTGYHVYTPYTCVTIAGGPHYVIDGTGCVADVYRLNKTQQRLIARNQPFSLYLEADSA